MRHGITDIKRQVDRDGFAYLPRHDLELSILVLAGILGKVIEIPGVPPVQRIVPREQNDSSLNLYSGNFGLQEFPLHTDLAHWYIPPRYFVLRCVEPASIVFTALLDFMRAFSGVSESKIRRALFVPHKSLDGAKHLLRLLQRNATSRLFRRDSVFIVPANKEAKYIRDHFCEISKGEWGQV